LKKLFYLSGIFYLLAGIILFPYLRYYADNPDTFQYLEIAQKYMAGDWQHAINGYWSPLICWLLVIPLMLIKVELLAFKILQFIIGMFALYQWLCLLNKAPLSEGQKKTLLFFSIPFLLSHAFLNATPDLLFLAELLLLMNLLWDVNVFVNGKRLVLLALTGVLLFLTKSFGFPLFIALVFFMSVKEYYDSGKSRQIFMNGSKVLLIFFLGCIPWIAAISIKYKKITLSEAAAFNMSKDVAPLPGRPEELPVLGVGLLEPTENSASAWETPGAFVSEEKINLLHSTADYILIVKRNLLSVYYFDFRNQVGIVFLLLLLIFIFKKGIQLVLSDRVLFISLLMIVLIYGGYSLVLFHTRYAWINTWLMVLFSAYFIQELLSSKKMRAWGIIFFFFVVALAIKRPLKEILFTSDKEVPAHWIFHAATHPFTTLWIYYKPDYDLENFIRNLDKEKFQGIKMASLKSQSQERDSYTSALRIMRGLGGKYFGQLDDKLTIDEQKSELQKLNIQYLVTWRNTSWGIEHPVLIDAVSGIQVFSLK
jgi:hypothetical protein